MDVLRPFRTLKEIDLIEEQQWSKLAWPKAIINNVYRPPNGGLVLNLPDFRRPHL